MKIKRTAIQTGFGTKLMIFMLIAAISLIASLSLSPEAFHSGLPQEKQDSIILQTRHPISTSSPTLLDSKGVEVVEHIFADENDVDPGDDTNDNTVDVEIEQQQQLEAEKGDAIEENADGRINEDTDDGIKEQQQQEEEDDEKEDNSQQQQQEPVPIAAQEAINTGETSALAVTDTQLPAAAISKDDTDDASIKKIEKKISPKQQYHIVVSVGHGIYTEWQIRVCYYQYKKIKAQYPNTAMGGFTRLLHSGAADAYMEEIPTVVVDQLPHKYQQIANGYVVLNRPWGFKQWVDTYMAKIPEQYILMAEPDHLFVKPPPLLASPTKPAAFPFFYIEPQAPANADIVNRYNKKKVPLSKFFPIGNSPVMISKKQMGPIVQKWVNISLAIKQDEEADKKWGWIQEMYAWSIASTQTALGAVEYSIHKELMLQPPWDKSLQINGQDAYIIHYTYGNDYNEAGVFTPGKVGAWHWDKRDYSYRYPPLVNPMPPENCQNEVVKYLIAAINDAAAHLAGWESKAYESAGLVKSVFDTEASEEEERRSRKMLSVF